jgi:hypothetical protein
MEGRVASIGMTILLAVAAAIPQDNPLTRQIVFQEQRRAELPVAQFLAFRCVSRGNCFAQQLRLGQGVSAGAVFEVDRSGRQIKSYDLSKAKAGGAFGIPYLSVDAKGNAHLLVNRRQEQQWQAVIYSFEDGTEQATAVILSKPIDARQILRLSDGTWVVAGAVTVPSGETGTPQRRQVLYQFRKDGTFLRELWFTVPATSASAEPDSESEIVLGHSHLLSDGGGNLYLITPSEAPAIRKFASSGELLLETELPRVKQSAVIAALLTEAGGLLLDRATVGRPGQTISERMRRITYLDTATLTVQWEADCRQEFGRLGDFDGDQFLFLHVDPTQGVHLVFARLL